MNETEVLLSKDPTAGAAYHKLLRRDTEYLIKKWYAIDFDVYSFALRLHKKQLRAIDTAAAS